MPISVTCQCGSRLEIDEKFLGKEIPCPDCQRPLPTKPPATPPPLDLPDNRRMSALAVLSLTLAIVGAFTIVGTLTAIAVGLLALREILKRPGKLEGIGVARAGIVTGAVMTFVTLAMLFMPTAFGLDMFLREFKFASRVQYPKIKTLEGAGANAGSIDRPGERWERWGGYLSPSNQNPNVQTDDLIMVNTVEDAYVGCQNVFIGLADNAEERKNKALERFKTSELVNLIGELDGRPLERDWTIVDDKKAGEVTLDLRLGKYERRILIQFASLDQIRLNINVGCARKSQFDRLEPDFRQAFKSRK